MNVLRVAPLPQAKPSPVQVTRVKTSHSQYTEPSLASARGQREHPDPVGLERALCRLGSFLRQRRASTSMPGWDLNRLTGKQR